MILRQFKDHNHSVIIVVAVVRTAELADASFLVIVIALNVKVLTSPANRIKGINSFGWRWFLSCCKGWAVIARLAQVSLFFQLYSPVEVTCHKDN